MQLAATKFVPVVLAAASQMALSPQTPQSVREPTFEVVSIRQNDSDSGETSFRADPGGRLTLVNWPLRSIIESAYQMTHDRLIGGPEWVKTVRFDIIAKTEGSPSRFEMLRMLQPLLADRFKLVIHREQRQMPIYELVVSRSDGKLGSQIKPASSECADNATAREKGDPEAIVAWRNMPQCEFSMKGPSLSSRASSLAQLADIIEGQVARPVINKSGLAGFYQIQLSWASNQADTSAPSIFTALQEQLGLRLVLITGNVEVLVIDSVQRPSPN